MTDNIPQIVSIGMQNSMLEVLAETIPTFMIVFAAFYGFKWLFSSITDSPEYDNEFEDYPELSEYEEEEIERMSGVLGIGDYEGLYDKAKNEGYTGTFEEFKYDKSAVESVYNSD